MCYTPFVSERDQTVFSVRSDKHGDLDGASLEETLAFVDAPAYGPGRNFLSDSLHALAGGETMTLRDGYDRKTAITKEG